MTVHAISIFLLISVRFNLIAGNEYKNNFSLSVPEARSIT